MFKISSAKLTGNPALPGWVQIYDFKPDDPEKLEKRGHLFAVISASREEEGIDKVVAGREILTRLHEEYFGKLEGTAFNTLKSALEKVISEFKTEEGGIQIAAISQMKDVVYSAAGGGSEVGILRKGMFAKILVSKEESVTSASGFPQENDILVLGTKGFFESVTDGFLKGVLESGSLEDSFESLSSKVQSQEKTEVGCLILKFEKEESFSQTEAVFQSELPRKSILETGKEISQKTISKVSGIGKFFERRIPQRKIYIKKSFEEVPDEKRKTTLSVGALLIILLFVSIFFGIRQKSIREKKESYSDRLSQATHLFEQSVGLYEVEPERAREIFRGAYEIILQFNEEEKKDSDVAALIKSVEEKKGEILGEYQKESKLFVDLSLLSDNFLGDEICLSGGRVFVIDKSSEKIVSIEVGNKKTSVVSGPDRLEEPQSLACYEERVYVLENNGIFRVDSKREEAVKKDWSGTPLIKSYAGNIYLLEKENNAIYRYPGVDDGFASRQNWLAPGVEPDFSLVKRMEIDGSIWILTSSNKILRFSLGSPQNFNPEGEYPIVSSIDAFYTDEEVQNVYLLEKSQKRILSYDKEGKFKAQYYFSNSEDVEDFIVSESEKKIILLVKGKLLYLEI